jgi:methylated-DNA-[protein]-cysteine S-methyltransferase
MEKGFAESCYKLVKKVSAGKLVTYKSLANKLNSNAYRVVGTAMKNNTNKKVPCHRVIKSNGEIGNFNKGQKAKIYLLKKEGIPIFKNKIPNFQKFLYKLSN